MHKGLLHIAFIILCFSSNAQSAVFKENGKWGIKESEKVIIPAVYDTIFDFDKTNTVCLACTKTKQVSTNKFLRSQAVSYNCSYLNKKLERLIVKTEAYDTIGIFSLNKSTVTDFQNDSQYIVASVKDKRFLVKKDFTQITRGAYTEISKTEIPEYLMVEIKTEGNQILKGLINLNEKEIIPLVYSNIKFNPRDSLIVGCSAGLGNAREDDVFDYNGKKLSSYRRHVDIATKDFIIHKIWEPKELYIIYNIITREEKVVYTEEIKLHSGNELLMRNDDHWFTYDLNTGKKKAYDIKNLKKQL